MKHYNWIEQKAIDMVYSIFTSPFYGKTIEAKCTKVMKVKVDGKVQTVLAEERPIYKKPNGRMNKMIINAFIDNYGKEKKYKIRQLDDGVLLIGLSPNNPTYIIKFIDKTVLSLC